MTEDLKWSNYDFTKIPFDDIVSVGQRTLLYRDLFTVSWLLGRFCNYNCSYCWPYARSNKKDHRPTELCLATIDEIKRQARDNNFNSFHFSLSGGEPTFHPGYLDILKHLADDVGNTNYTIIPFNSPNKAAALILQNVLLSGESQYQKALPNVWGAKPAISINRTSSEVQANFAAIKVHPNVAPAAELARAALPELQASWISAIEKGWLKNVGQ